LSTHATLLCALSEDRRRNANLSLVGELGESTADQFLEAAGGALARFPASLTLDLSGLVHLDSRGMASLLAVVRMSRTAEARFRLIHAKTNIRKAFQVKGLVIGPDGHIKPAYGGAPGPSGD
jgi:ABC-type transporter Mla MlaB component